MAVEEIVTPRRVDRADGQPLPADDPLEPVRGVVRDHPPVIHHGDLVGERVVGEHQPVAQHIRNDLEDVLRDRIVAAADQR